MVVKLNVSGLMLFDIDGVIRDVSNSYRLAVKKTVSKYCNWEPSSFDIDNLKNEGIWNNDWDLSLELITRFMSDNNIKNSIPQKEHIIKSFEKLYFGCNPNKSYQNWSGFICNERILINKNIFETLSLKNIKWGFVSGAEKPSAKYVLEEKLHLKDPPLVAMGDAPDKPNPSGLIYLANKLLKQEIGLNTPPIAYIGDTIADIKTILNARKKIPSQVFISIGVAPPHLHKASLEKERSEYEIKLKNSGADIILNSVNDIQYIYSDIFKK